MPKDPPAAGSTISISLLCSGVTGLQKGKNTRWKGAWLTGRGRGLGLQANTLQFSRVWLASRGES